MIVESVQAATPSRSEIERQRPDDSDRKQTAPDLAPEPDERPAASSLNDTSQSRLTFDEELNRVFVEIVNKDSGEVVQRFPPEQLVRHMAELIKDIESPSITGSNGQVFDRLV